MRACRTQRYVGACLFCAALLAGCLSGCVPSDAPETHRIPFKEELDGLETAPESTYQSTPTSAEQIGVTVHVTGNIRFVATSFASYQAAIEEGRAVARGEKKPGEESQAASDSQSQGSTDQPTSPSKPGQAYIDATSPEDRAVAAKAATSYITEQTDSRLDKLLLTPDDTYHFWRVPGYLKEYDKPGNVLIFEAYCNGEKTPDAVLLIKEADHVWTVKIFNTQQEYDGLFKQQQ